MSFFLTNGFIVASYLKGNCWGQLTQQELYTQMKSVRVDGVAFEVVADLVFSRFLHQWKRSTMNVNRIYLKNQILPFFQGRQIHSITRADILEWFGSLSDTPCAANRSLPILSVILREAEVHGYRPEDSNPCSRLRRYRELPRERFLNKKELVRIGKVLTVSETDFPIQTAIVRLLLLTGCRQSEIRTLEWKEFGDRHLFLRDSKTGPRTVWLSASARKVLHRLPRVAQHVFPSKRKTGPLPVNSLQSWWRKFRVSAGIPDLRLHDLRHTYASLALQQGESIVTVGRLLGHRDTRSTLRYAHCGDSLLRAAVERVSVPLSGS